jgi:hypothetical protein
VLRTRLRVLLREREDHAAVLVALLHQRAPLGLQRLAVERVHVAELRDPPIETLELGPQRGHELVLLHEVQLDRRGFRLLLGEPRLQLAADHREQPLERDPLEARDVLVFLSKPLGQRSMAGVLPVEPPGERLVLSAERLTHPHGLGRVGQLLVERSIHRRHHTVGRSR